MNNAVVRYGTSGNSVCCADIKVNNAVVRYGTTGSSVCCTDVYGQEGHMAWEVGAVYKVQTMPGHGRRKLIGPWDMLQ